MSSRPGRIEAVGRLVEKQEIGIVDQRLGELDPLLQARRVALDLEVALVLEVHQVERGVRALSRRLARQPRQLAGVGAELDGVHAGEVALGLGHVADAIADGEGLGFRRQTEDARLALEGREAEQRLDQRRFARAVGAQQADPLAGDHAGEAAQRLDRAVALAHALELEHVSSLPFSLGHRQNFDRARHDARSEHVELIGGGAR
jgi:hypothetical protein